MRPNSEPGRGQRAEEDESLCSGGGRISFSPRLPLICEENPLSPVLISVQRAKCVKRNSLFVPSAEILPERLKHCVSPQSQPV